MLYVSTRGKADMLSSAHVMKQGLASDGGLFVPQRFPRLTLDEILHLHTLSYADAAAKIISLFLTDFTRDEVAECTRAAYDEARFGADPVPLVRVNESTDMLELWHGPTSAFKDMALQLLPRLLVKSIAKTADNRKCVILVATSGDTGKAALAGFADVPGTEIIVFYPQDGVSAMQQCQMVTQPGGNVHVFGIEGNFDDAQRGVKEIFGSQDMQQQLKQHGFAFSSANSINWGRLVPQIVYYFRAYAEAVANGRIAPGQHLNFCVPTGNFGDILAGYYAKKMGLPVQRFLCASNSNNVLTDFINNGVYDRRREFHKTASPSMDILVSSNLERLLYDLTDEDAEQVAEWMQQLADVGTYSVGNDVAKRVRENFFGAWVDEIETTETIGRVYNDYHYLLDPHTAVAWRAVEKYRLLTSDNTYTVVLSTASPYKFCSTVLRSLGEGADVQDDAPFDAMRRLSAVTGTELPQPLADLESLPVLHPETVDAPNMGQAVLESLELI